MKSRIVSVLRDIADGKRPSVQAELEIALGKTPDQLQKTAEQTLTDILHQYGRFAVVTIDSFFHQVIRSFAKEMGLQGSFSIDLDLDKVMQQVVDDMLLRVGEDDKKSLKKWLTQFASERVENGESWDVRKEINKLSAQVLKDDFKPYSKEVLKLGENPAFFTELKKELDKIRYSFENTLKSKASEGLKIMRKHGVDPGDFKGGKTQSPANLFVKLQDEIVVTDGQRKKVGNHEDWVKAKAPNGPALDACLAEGLANLFDEIIAYHDDHLMVYESSKEALRYIYTFGILTEINRRIQDYRDENDVMLIADLPDFLHQIINDNDTPYIYEKVGSMFQHYLIDEFQDTSSFQWDNFRPLVRNASDQGEFSMVVGDVKQSIYRWRGGDWQLLQNRVKSDMGGSEMVHEDNLAMNWRSSYEVVQFNNQFFTESLNVANAYFQNALEEVLAGDRREQISGRIAEVLATYADVVQEVPAFKEANQGLIQVEFLSELDSEEDEGWKDLCASRTIKAVEEAQRSGYQLRDIAILTRNKKEGKLIANAFVNYSSSEEADPQLKYEVVSSEALYLTSSHLVRFVISLIKWLNDEDNTIVLAEWLFEYERYIKNSTKSETEIFSARNFWHRVVPPAFVKEKDYLKTLPLYELVERLIGIFELNQHKVEFTYLQGFQDAILDYSKNERGDISSFLTWWEEVKDLKTIQLSDDNNAVKILTIHKSKGLEFPVVIIPFLNWDLDHSATNENIMWCQPGAEPPYNRLPVIPLRYGKSLANTYWAMEYYDEKLKAFLDNLNLLYVAFTRPVDALFAFGKLPKPPRGKDQPDLEKLSVKSISDFCLTALKDQDAFDESIYQYSVGQWPAKKHGKEVSSEEFALGEYHCHSWREKVGVQVRGALELGQTIFNESQRQGLRIHDLISRVKYKDDLEQVLDSPERTFVTKVVEHPKLADWFDRKWQVDTEVGFLLPGGDMRRVDRMNRSKDQTIVIDFKTGIPREKDKKQVREYVSILQSMEYPDPKGYLVYLSDMEVVAV